VERPRVARALPAATVVLMRDSASGLEVLLLRRNQRAGFVPGAYVFPGGRVDPADSSPHALARLDGLTAERAAERLDLPDGDPPAIAYYVAALREAFEETGILVGGPPADRSARPGAGEVAPVREDLLEDRITFAEALARLDRRASADALEYLAHWITPEREPRRYDTRFFAARIPEGAEPVIDAREMTHALWITPAAGVLGAREKELPMILPTVRTLEQLSAFRGTEEVLQALPHLAVPTILPGPDVGDPSS
jgi:8-oxo-dGTP pyrophosphatase MutT (NUDIX family)